MQSDTSSDDINPSNIVKPQPSWYKSVKYGIPAVSVLAAAGTMASFILGIIPVPQMFGMAQWLPVIYSGYLKGFAAQAMLGSCTAIAGLVAGFASYGMLRATALFNVNEQRADQADQCQVVANSQYARILDLKQELADVSEAFQNQRRMLSNGRSQRINRVVNIPGAVTSDASATQSDPGNHSRARL